jgi:hypothetical protein
MSVVLGVPPGLDGVLTVRAEHGDILFTPTWFCALVLDNALTWPLWLVAHVTDERHRVQPALNAGADDGHHHNTSPLPTAFAW